MTAPPPEVPGYQLLHEIGRGGMGVVWLARQLSLDRLVAIKLLAPEAASLVDLARFRREARFVQRLSHPGVVRMFDHGVEGPVPYIALEYVESASTLTKVIALESLAFDRAMKYARALAEALAHVHAAGIVHRDVKPGNVLVDREDRARLIDLGLARSLTPDETRALTQAGDMMGTLAYMAPEQMAAEPATPRADVYAFGLVLYELLSGRIVFGATDPAAVRPGHRLAGAIPSLAMRGVEAPPALIEVVERCLRLEPGERYADAGEVVAALERPEWPRRSVSVRVPPRAPRPAVPLAPAVVALLALGAVIGALLPSRAALPARQVAVPESMAAVDSARRLQATLQSVRLRLDERWLAGFAAEHRAALLGRDEAAKATVSVRLRDHLERAGVQPALDAFLAEAAAYFRSARVPEPERWSMRSALCDIELLEHFCREHRVPWPAASTLAGLAGEWDRPVDPEAVDVSRGRSWVVRESWYESAFGGPARTVTFPLGESPRQRALLWFSTTAWRTGYVLDVLVNRRVRRLLALRPRPEPPLLRVRAVEYRLAAEVHRDHEVVLLSGESWEGDRGYLGTWLPPGVLAPVTEVRCRVIALPLARAAITDAALRERVLTVFPGAGRLF